MDNQRISSLLFLLGSAAIAMPGCDLGDDDGDTNAGTETSDTDASASNSDSNSDSASETSQSGSDSEPTTASDTTPTSATTTDSGTTGDDTTPTTASSTTNDSDTDPTGVGDTGSTSSTGAGQPVCTDFANLYVECYSKEYYDAGLMVCDYVLSYAETISQECLDANIEFFECLNTLDCKALASKGGPEGCEKESAAADTICELK